MMLAIIPSFMQNWEMIYFCMFCLLMMDFTDWIDRKWKK